MSAARNPLRSLVAATVVFATAGALEGVSIAALYGASWRWALHASAMFALVALFWVPVTIAVLRLWDGEPRGQRLAAWLGVGLIVVVVAQPLWQRWVNPLGAQHAPPYVVRLATLSDTNVAFFLAIVGFAWLAAARRAHADAMVASARLEAALVDLELQILTSQLHPHFLFNTLNLVSQLAYEDESRALATLDNLRRLLAESIEHVARPDVALGDELRFLRAYLDIQQSRFGSALRVAIDVDHGAEDLAVPHLLLQPLVENAIVHGLASRATLGELHVRVARAGDRVAIVVEDDGVGMPPSVREGMGLANTRLRLERLYGDDFSLRCEPGGDGGTKVTVELPARTPTARGMSESEREPAAEAAHAESPLLARVRRTPLAFRVVAGWSAVAIVWTEVSAAAAAAGGMAFDRPRVLASYGLNAMVWMALTPIVLWLVRRVDVRASTRLRRTTTYVAAGATIVLAHLVLWLATLRWLVPSQFQPSLRTAVGWALWDAVAYAALVSFAAAALLDARLRDARVQMARAQSAMSRARLAALRLRLQPAILMAGLDAVRHAIGRGAVVAESAIARLGELLRMLLDSSSEEMADVDREVALLRAYVDAVCPSADATWDVAPIGAAVPAVSFIGLAATVAGAIDAVRVFDDRGAIALEIGTRGGTVAPDRLDELRLRLDGLFPGQVHVETRLGDGCMWAWLRMPSSPRVSGADEESAVLVLAAR
jgi:signal transduction histidine kinase